MNEREPWMLTVGELRQALNTTDPNQVVIFGLSADDLAYIRTAPSGMGVVLAVKVDRASPNGPIFRLAPNGPGSVPASCQNEAGTAGIEQHQDDERTASEQHRNS